MEALTSGPSHGGKKGASSRASGTAAAGPPPGPRAGSLSPVLAYFLPTAPGRLRGSRILTDSVDPDRSRILTDTGGTGRHSTPPDSSHAILTHPDSFHAILTVLVRCGGEQTGLICVLAQGNLRRIWVGCCFRIQLQIQIQIQLQLGLGWLTGDMVRLVEHSIILWP